MFYFVDRADVGLESYEFVFLETVRNQMKLEVLEKHGCPMFCFQHQLVSA